MQITFEQLRTFLVVARSGGVGKAADEMNLTQPAVTARIRNLERELGAALFDRRAGMALTKAGLSLITYAEHHLKLNDLILRDVAEPGGVAQLFRIGVSETIVQSWLPDFIGALRRAYPALTVEIDVDISFNLRRQLLVGAIDFAVMMGPVSDYRVENVALPAYPMAWFRKTGASAGPGSSPVITFARDTRPFRVLKETLFERYGPGATIFPSSSLSACFRLVAAGLGVGALPRALARAHLDAAEIELFDPGWTPEALEFTASFVATPTGALGVRAAEIARACAEAFDKSSL